MMPLEEGILLQDTSHALGQHAVHRNLSGACVIGSVIAPYCIYPPAKGGLSDTVDMGDAP